MTSSMMDRRFFLASLSTAVALPYVAKAADPIRMGFAMPLTGALAGGGKMLLLGLEVWRDEVNSKGGLLGRPIEFVYYDDQSNPALVPAIYAKLMDVDKVHLLLSSFGTNQIVPAMPIVIERKRLLMGLVGTGVNERHKYDKYFQILPNGPESKRSLSTGFFQVAGTMQPRPVTVALLGADAEFSLTVLTGARENAGLAGLKVVYDQTYPAATTDFVGIMKAVQATKPDVIFVASYPQDSVGIVRAISETQITPRMFGGAMIGLSFTSTKLNLGEALNGIVNNDNYVPEPTMKFPGVEDFLRQYQGRAAKAGADPLGYFLAPFGYAAMQILGSAIKRTGGTDEQKLAALLHEASFETIIGSVKFGADGEWERTRILTTQYRDIKGKDLEQFKQPGRQVILYPPDLKSGDLVSPFLAARGK